jgi:hypothetical protein
MIELVKAISGMFIVLTLWVAIQRFVRRRSGCPNPDKDVLDFMLNGCGGGCSGKGLCHIDSERGSQ